jgi:hypothetical protein
MNVEMCKVNIVFLGSGQNLPEHTPGRWMMGRRLFFTPEIDKVVSFLAFKSMGRRVLLLKRWGNEFSTA